MGIADFGQASGGTVSYNTSSFEGSATVESLSVCASSSPCGSTQLSLQLNVVLGFEDGGNWYVYWVQDVASLNTSTQSVISISNNIWNFSGSGASMYSSTVSGNGAVYSYHGQGYYAYGIGTSEGDGAFQLILNSSVNSQGQPVVRFMYDFGSGVQTYDAATFVFVNELDYSDGFIVDGSTSNPAGLGYDAEWVLGGPGGGSSTIDESSNIQLTLQFWNGHNYETINNAENHGEDTGETITNTDDVGYYYTSDGWLYSQVSAGTENIAPLWFSTNIALVELQGPGTHNATLEWGTSVCVPYQPCAGDVIISYLSGNATIAVGPVTLELGVIVGNEGVVLGPYSFGPATFTVVSAGNWYTVNFLERGLPSGTSWGVSVGGDRRVAPGALLSFYVPFFEAPFTVFGGAGFLPIPSAGTFYLTGSGENISIDWELVPVSSSAASKSVDVGQSVTFSVTLVNDTTVRTFDWIGLPAGCSSVNNSVVQCIPTSADLASITVKVTDSNDFTATTEPLNFTVYADPTVTPPAGTPSSSDVGQSATFSTVLSPGSGGDTFVWTGLPKGCLSSNSTTIACSPTAAGVFLLNVTVTDSNGYVATATGTFTVFLLPTVVSVSVSPGTSILDGQALTFSVNATVGSGGLTYAWAGLPTGCQATSTASVTCTPSSTGTWNVSVTVTDSNGGSASSLGVTVVVQPSFLGLPALEGYALFIVAPIVAALAIGLAVVARRRNRRRRALSYSGGNAGGAQPYSPSLDPSFYGRSPEPAAGSQFAGTAPTEAGVSPVRFEEAPTGIEGLDPGSVSMGTPLINPPDPVCWHCHFENQPGSRYCASCAVPLEPPPPTPGR